MAANQVPQINWDSVPDANTAPGTKAPVQSAAPDINWDAVPSMPQTTGEISPVAPPVDRQQGIQRWFGDLEGDIRHGTGATLPGRVLRGMGAPGIESGAGGGESGVGNIMGGSVIGPAEIGSAVFGTRPEDTTQQRVKLANKMFRGVGHTGALPAAAFGGPEVLPSLGIYGGIGQGASATASFLGANPDEAELTGNVAGYAAPLIKTGMAPLGRTISRAAPAVGQGAGWTAAGLRFLKTRDPSALLYASPYVTRAVTRAVDLAGRGMQYVAGPPELGPGKPPAMRMPNAEAQDAQAFGKQVMGINLPGPGGVRSGPTNPPPAGPREPLSLGRGAIITPPPPGSVPEPPSPPGSMEGRPATNVTPPTPKPRGRGRQMSNLPPFLGLPQTPPPVHQPTAQQETVNPQEEPVPPLITTWGAPSTTPKALSEAPQPALAAAPQPETPPLINTQPLTKEPEKPIINQEAQNVTPEAPVPPESPQGISRRGLFGLFRGGRTPEPPAEVPAQQGPDHEALMGIAQQAVQNLYPDNPDQMMSAHVEDQNHQEGQWDAHDLLTDVLHGYMDAIARTDPESTVRQHMIWTLKKNLPLFQQAGAMGDPASAQAYQENLPTPEKLDEYFKNINEPPPGPRMVSRAPKPAPPEGGPENYPKEPGLIGPTREPNAIEKIVNKPVSRRSFLTGAGKAAIGSVMPQGALGDALAGSGVTSVSGDLANFAARSASSWGSRWGKLTGPMMMLADALHRKLNNGQPLDPQELYRRTAANDFIFPGDEEYGGPENWEPHELFQQVLGEHSYKPESLENLKASVPLFEQAKKITSLVPKDPEGAWSGWDPTDFNKEWDMGPIQESIDRVLKVQKMTSAESFEEHYGRKPTPEELEQYKRQYGNRPADEAEEAKYAEENKAAESQLDQDKLGDKGFQEQGRESIERGEQGAADLKRSRKNPDELFPWAEHPYGPPSGPVPPKPTPPEEPPVAPIVKTEAKAPPKVAPAPEEAAPLVDTSPLADKLTQPMSRRNFLKTGGQTAANSMIPSGISEPLIAAALKSQLPHIPTSLPEAVSMAAKLIPGVIHHIWNRFDLSGDDEVDYNGGYLDVVGEGLTKYAKAKGITGPTRASWKDVDAIANEGLDEDAWERDPSHFWDSMAPRVREVLKDSGITFDREGVNFDPKDVHLMHDISHLVGESYNAFDVGEEPRDYYSPEQEKEILNSLSNVAPKLDHRDAIGWSDRSREELYQEWLKNDGPRKAGLNQENRSKAEKEAKAKETEGTKTAEPVDRTDLIETKGFQEHGRQSIESGEEGTASLQSRRFYKNNKPGRGHVDIPGEDGNTELFPWAQHPYGTYEPPGEPNVPPEETPPPTNLINFPKPKANIGGIENKFWKDTYPNLPDDEKQKFDSQIEAMGGVPGHSLGAITKDTKLEQLSEAERSLIALMDTQNRKKKPLVDTPTTEKSYTTKLSADEEAKFQQWVKDNKIPWRDEPKADYDMRGFWKAQQSGDPNAKQAANLHFPDTYKTPYHKTFSNESKYATPDAPHWEGNKLIDKSGKIVADETPKPAKTPKKPSLVKQLQSSVVKPEEKPLIDTSPTIKKPYDPQAHDVARQLADHLYGEAGTEMYNDALMDTDDPNEIIKTLIKNKTEDIKEFGFRGKNPLKTMGPILDQLNPTEGSASHNVSGDKPEFRSRSFDDMGLKDWSKQDKELIDTSANKSFSKEDLTSAAKNVKPADRHAAVNDFMLGNTWHEIKLSELDSALKNGIKGATGTTEKSTGANPGVHLKLKIPHLWEQVRKGLGQDSDLDLNNLNLGDVNPKWINTEGSYVISPDGLKQSLSSYIKAKKE